MRLVQSAARAAIRYLLPRAGLELESEAADRNLAASPVVLTPDDVARVLRAADSGDAREQTLLARDVLEKDENICHAVETRRNAITGCRWAIEPGDGTPEAAAAAKEFERQLHACGGDGLDDFGELIDDLTGALLPGFALSEICWGPGGSIAGFSAVEPWLITFRDSYAPLITTNDTPLGMPLTANKYIFHQFRRRGKDPARGGLIRPLAWLHCFASVNTKDLLRFVERYATPFLLVSVSDESWEIERLRLVRLIKEMGSGGGAVVRQNTTVTPVQASSANGEAYFRLLDYLGSAITKVVLGQTATAGDGGGWSNDGAQAQVRQDILEADCRWIEATINRQLALPWVKFNAPLAAPPVFRLLCDPPDDEVKANQALQSRYEAMGVAVRGGLLTPTQEIEEMVRKSLKLPPVSEAARQAWAAADGVRLPITLQQKGAPPADPFGLAAMGAEPPAAASLPDETAKQLIGSGALERWLGPVAAAVGDAADAPDEEFAARLAALAESPPTGDSAELEETLAKEAFAGIASGMTEAAARLRRG